MRSAYDIIVLSPHLDDAAYSCGGFIGQQTAAGCTVLIATLLAGDPPQAPFSSYAQSMHARWELASQIVARRRLEDQVACRILGADYYHAALLDAIYRSDAETGAYYYTSNEALFGPLDDRDKAHMLPEMSTVFQTLPAAAVVLAPLGVGNHVDHQLVRLAAEAFYGGDLEYYEDYPYAREPNAVSNLIARERRALAHRTIPLRENDLDQKAESIAAFASQISTFFDDRNDIKKQVQAYAHQVGGERYWQRASTR